MAAKKPMTKAQLSRHISEKAGLTIKAAGELIDELAAVAYKETKKYMSQVLSLANIEITRMELQLEKIKQQKRGLMQKLLTGEWRVNTETGIKTEN